MIIYIWLALDPSANTQLTSRFRNVDDLLVEFADLDIRGADLVFVGAELHLCAPDAASSDDVDVSGDAEDASEVGSKGSDTDNTEMWNLHFEKKGRDNWQKTLAKAKETLKTCM